MSLIPAGRPVHGRQESSHHAVLSRNLSVHRHRRHPLPCGGAPAGQGFGQAAEDALALGHAMREHGLTPAALRAFEDARWPRVAKVAETEQVQSPRQRWHAPPMHRAAYPCIPE